MSKNGKMTTEIKLFSIEHLTAEKISNFKQTTDLNYFFFLFFFLNDYIKSFKILRLDIFEITCRKNNSRLFFAPKIFFI